MRHHLQENHEINESEPGTDYLVYTMSPEPQEAFQQSQLTAPMSTSKLGEPKASLQRHVGETNLLAFVKLHDKEDNLDKQVNKAQVLSHKILKPKMNACRI